MTPLSHLDQNHFLFNHTGELHKTYKSCGKIIILNKEVLAALNKAKTLDCTILKGLSKNNFYIKKLKIKPGLPSPRCCPSAKAWNLQFFFFTSPYIIIILLSMVLWEGLFFARWDVLFIGTILAFEFFLITSFFPRFLGIRFIFGSLWMRWYQWCVHFVQFYFFYMCNVWRGKTGFDSGIFWSTFFCSFFIYFLPH